MGAGAVTTMKRYRQNQKPEVYFEHEVYPAVEGVFHILGLPYPEALELFRKFVELDFYCTGMIDIKAIYKIFGVKATKFTDRVFTFMDKDGDTTLDFREFVIGLWNYCTYDARQIARVCFGFFDLDRTGEIDMADVDAMLRMVYDSPDSDWDTILEVFGKEGRDDTIYIKLGAWQDKIEKKPRILQPAFDLQKSIRKRTFGINYWEAKQVFRKENMGKIDEESEESWGGLLDILAKKKRENPEMEDESPPPIEEDPLARYVIPEESQYLDLKEKSLHVVRRERKDFSDMKVKALEMEKTQEDENEKVAWERLEEAKKNVNMKYLVSEPENRAYARRNLWDAVDNVMEKSRTLARVKEELAVELARGPDAEAKCQQFLVSTPGIKRFEFETMNQYGVILREYFNHNLALQIFAGAFDASHGRVTWATSMVYRRLSTKAMMEHAKKRAREVIVEEIREREHQNVKKTWSEKLIAREHDFQSLIDSLVLEFGRRDSKWERLWDVSTEDEVMYNINTQQLVPGRQAICEKCDSLLLPEDTRCLTCNAPRSVANKSLYKALELTTTLRL